MAGSSLWHKQLYIDRLLQITRTIDNRHEIQTSRVLIVIIADLFHFLIHDLSCSPNEKTSNDQIKPGYKARGTTLTISPIPSHRQNKRKKEQAARLALLISMEHTSTACTHTLLPVDLRFELRTAKVEADFVITTQVFAATGTRLLSDNISHRSHVGSNMAQGLQEIYTTVCFRGKNELLRARQGRNVSPHMKYNSRETTNALLSVIWSIHSGGLPGPR